MSRYDKRQCKSCGETFTPWDCALCTDRLDRPVEDRCEECHNEIVHHARAKPPKSGYRSDRVNPDRRADIEYHGSLCGGTE